MTHYTVYVDCFTALDDLTRRQQADPDAVLALLRRVRRFSVFDANENDTIARTMTRLQQRGRITVDHSEGYPWLRVTHIDGVALEDEG